MTLTLQSPRPAVATVTIVGRGPLRRATASTPRAVGVTVPGFTLVDRQRAGYHGAPSIASNFVVPLLVAAERVAVAAGLTEPDAGALLAPLVRSTVANWVAHGPEAVLTGPVARGNVRTVANQRDAIVSHPTDLLELFDALAASTRTPAATGKVVA